MPAEPAGAPTAAETSCEEPRLSCTLRFFGSPSCPRDFVSTILRLPTSANHLLCSPLRLRSARVAFSRRIERLKIFRSDPSHASSESRIGRQPVLSMPSKTARSTTRTTGIKAARFFLYSASKSATEMRWQAPSSFKLNSNGKALTSSTMASRQRLHARSSSSSAWPDGGSNSGTSPPTSFSRSRVKAARACTQYVRRA